jgi:flagellar biosynthesis/type III secretory pathway chaperone
MGLDHLSICLWDEQAALEDLAFRLEQELLVLTSGRHQWLNRTTAEVAVALNRLGDLEKRRLEISRSVAEELGVTGDATLSALAEASVPDDAKTLRDHRQRLRDLLGLVQGLAERTRFVLARNLAATNDALACMGATPVSAYDAGGAVRPRTRERSWLVDAKV